MGKEHSQVSKFQEYVRSIPAHPFLIAAYAVLALLGHNIEEIKAVAALRSILVVLAGCTLLFLALQLWLKNWLKSGLVASIILALFFAYGHVYQSLEPVKILGVALGRHRLLAVLWLVILVALVWWATRPRRDLPTITQSLNIVGVIALVFPLAQIGLFGVNTILAANKNPEKENLYTRLQVPDGQPAPDVYYIILDGYSRDDTLKDYYGLDNAAFLQQLAEMGFYVARCSQSNYAQTQLSLSSSLNMNYLSDLQSGSAQDDQTTAGCSSSAGICSRVGLAELIHHNAVRKLLGQLGYKSVAFETGFKVTQWEDADLYLSSQGGAMQKAQFLGGVTDFEVVFLRTTAGLILLDSATLLPKSLQQDLDNPRQAHRQMVLYSLEELGKMPGLPGPKLVFAHLVIPHRPFVFGPNGEPVDPNKADIPGYRDQVIYLNKQIIPLLQGMIQRSATPPIIILQGDHGGVDTSPEMRMRILNAYYLPPKKNTAGEGNQQLYPTITPVNTFRVIFNEYFGGSFERLPDISYYSAYKTPFEIKEVPNTRSDCD